MLKIKKIILAFPTCNHLENASHGLTKNRYVCVFNLLCKSFFGDVNVKSSWRSGMFGESIKLHKMNIFCLQKADKREHMCHYFPAEVNTHVCSFNCACLLLLLFCSAYVGFMHHSCMPAANSVCFSLFRQHQFTTKVISGHYTKK